MGRRTAVGDRAQRRGGCPVSTEPIETVIEQVRKELEFAEMYGSSKDYALVRKADALRLASEVERLKAENERMREGLEEIEFQTQMHRASAIASAALHPGLTKQLDPVTIAIHEEGTHDDD